jgi:hypothetical protein
VGPAPSDSERPIHGGKGGVGMFQTLHQPDIKCRALGDLRNAKYNNGLGDVNTMYVVMVQTVANAYVR